jgi:hypothetical protein
MEGHEAAENRFIFDGIYKLTYKNGDLQVYDEHKKVIKGCQK